MLPTCVQSRKDRVDATALWSLGYPGNYKQVGNRNVLRGYFFVRISRKIIKSTHEKKKPIKPGLEFFRLLGFCCKNPQSCKWLQPVPFSYLCLCLSSPFLSLSQLKLAKASDNPFAYESTTAWPTGTEIEQWSA